MGAGVQQTGKAYSAMLDRVAHPMSKSQKFSQHSPREHLSSCLEQQRGRDCLAQRLSGPVANWWPGHSVWSTVSKVDQSTIIHFGHKSTSTWIEEELTGKNKEINWLFHSRSAYSHLK